MSTKAGSNLDPRIKTSISLGTEDRLTVLYSYPNSAADGRSLPATIEHWFGQTLKRDGLVGSDASVRIMDGTYYLDFRGPDSAVPSFQLYAERLPQFLANGWAAWTNVVPMLKSTGKWDPCPDKSTPSAPYLPWRFFLPHGMPMLNQKALLFFHYPPIRLLETNQDYLNDPVPVRCEELLAANGVASLSPDNLASGDIMLFNTVVDATPIGAEDDQGSKNPKKCAADGCPATAYDKDYGLIPIQYFPDYQKAQVSLLLNPSPTKGYTAPIVIYGAHPLATFNKLYGTKLAVYQTTVAADIIPGLKTPVLASSHPYVFYGDAQGFDKDNIGSGIFTDPNRNSTAQMIKDLAVARWLKAMSEDPSQDVAKVWTACQAFWNDPARASAVSDLVQHQGSLWYNNPPSLDFVFKVPLQATTAAKSAATPAKPAAPAATKSVGVVSPKPAKAPQAKASGSGLQVIGDSGTPVDWWFIYKISQESQSPTEQSATGQEYLYFDSAMAKAGAKPVLSKNLIDQSGALHDTLSPLFSDAAKANKSLGWFCYNDEDRVVKKKSKVTNKVMESGTGPPDRGHCKGVLAFDLASNSAFWLIHSVPRFPMQAKYEYPDSGLVMAQTMLCISLADADTAKNIAQLMYDAHGPNVNVASDLLAAGPIPPQGPRRPAQQNGFDPKVLPLTDVLKQLGDKDPRVLLMQNTNNSMTKPKPYSGRVPFKSRGNQDFLAIAKNKAWGQDFYNDFVGKVLDEDIEVETWENAKGKIPAEQKAGETHKVENMKSVNLAPLGIPYSWSESVDHAKLAISDRSNAAGTDRWVCVGDINFTDAQERRGGGTVAFKCESLWNSLVKALSDQVEPGKPKKSSATLKKSAVAKKKSPRVLAAKKSGRALRKPVSRPRTARKQR